MLGARQTLSIKYQSRQWPAQLLNPQQISQLHIDKVLAGSQTIPVSGWAVRSPGMTTSRPPMPTIFCWTLHSTPISSCMLCCSFSKQDSKSVWTWDPRISRVFLWHWWHWHCNWNCLHLQDRRQDILTEDSSSTTTGNVIVDRSLSKYVVRALPSIADISLSFCSAHLSKIIRN